MTEMTDDEVLADYRARRAEAEKSYRPDSPPEQYPIGTWLRDRHGGTSMRATEDGYGEPGFYPTGRWGPMWEARGPYVECTPWAATEKRAEDAEEAAYAALKQSEQAEESVRLANLIADLSGGRWSDDAVLLADALLDAGIGFKRRARRR